MKKSVVSLAYIVRTEDMSYRFSRLCSRDVLSFNVYRKIIEHLKKVKAKKIGRKEKKRLIRIRKLNASSSLVELINDA